LGIHGCEIIGEALIQLGYLGWLFFGEIVLNHDHDQD
jgi:hypothetical protein